MPGAPAGHCDGNSSAAGPVSRRPSRRTPIRFGTDPCRPPHVGVAAQIFGRRDTVIFALYAGGLRPTDISALDRRDVTVAVDGLDLGGRHHLHLADIGDGAASIPFRSVWRNWEQVPQMVERHPATRVLQHHVATGEFRGEDATEESTVGPVVVPIDRWGAVPLPLTR